MRRLTPMEAKKRLWAIEQGNAMKAIAAECKVSPQFVSMVLYGNRKSKNGLVERALKRRQAPGIR